MVLKATMGQSLSKRRVSDYWVNGRNTRDDKWTKNIAVLKREVFLENTDLLFQRLVLAFQIVRTSKQKIKELNLSSSVNSGIIWF